jgi:hypothetical protein
MAPRPASFPTCCIRNRFSKTGIMNASVFPLPVLAAPKMSAPLRASGIARAWMSVRVVKLAALSPAFVNSDNGSSLKSLKVAFLGS